MEDDLQKSSLDVHFCLGCHSTIFGLDEYVEHRKSHCPAKISPAPPTTQDGGVQAVTPTTSAVNSPPSRPNGLVPSLPDLTKPGSIQPLLSPSQQPVQSEEVSPETINYHLVLQKKNKDLQLQNNSSKDEPEKSDNFFLSLELQSKVGQKGEGSEAEQLGEQRAARDKELPISSILNNLDFSSDDEPDAGEASSSEDGEWVPPSSHTGGKWRPGQRPQRQRSHPHPSHTGGKWRPGESPPVKRKRGRPRKTEKIERDPSPQLDPSDDDSFTDDDIDDDGFACDECPEVFLTIEDYAQHIAAGHDWEEENGTAGAIEAEPPAVVRSVGGEHNVESDPVLELQEASAQPYKTTEMAEESVSGDQDTVVLNNSLSSPSSSKQLKEDEVHVCTVCDKVYKSKYNIARHILTGLHKRRSEGHPDHFKVIQKYLKPLMYLSPYQCMICRFYFNTPEHLLDHVRTEEHKTKISRLICPVVCSTCNFSTTDHEGEMLAHLKSSEHSLNTQKSDKPCVIKKKLDGELECPHCKTKWKSYYMLQRHVEKRHPDGRPARPIHRGRGRVRPKCPFCLASCHSLTALTIHIRRKHTKQRPFKCECCDVTFCDKHSLLAHYKSAKHKRRTVNPPARQPDPTAAIKTVRKHRPHKCPQCDFVAKTYRALRPHFLKVHSQEKVKCIPCDQEFVSSKGLEIHQRATGHSNKPSEDGVVSLSCGTCGKTFQDPKWFEFHMVSHSFIFSESDLYKTYKGKDKTSLHYAEYLEEMDKLGRTDNATCPEPDCKKQVVKQHMIEHLRIHTNDRIFRCPYCELGFFSATVLKKHVHKHVGLTHRVCEICGREFTKVSTYKNHLLSHDESARNQHVCSICGMAFTLIECLRVHERRHGEKIHKCPHPGCRQKFVFKSELNEHSRIHSGYKPFLCDLCGYKARTKNHMRRHYRTHTGERKHHCDYCTYKAGNKTHLRRHMRIHIGSKPYKCPYCSYCCNTHENIRKHIMKTKKHQGLKIYPCKMCEFSTNVAKELRNHLDDFHAQELKEANIDVLSVLAGVYDKEVDVERPLEGNMILPVKERQKGSKRNKPKKPTSAKIWSGVQDKHEMTNEDIQAAICLAENSVIQYSRDNRWLSPGQLTIVVPEEKDEKSPSAELKSFSQCIEEGSQPTDYSLHREPMVYEVHTSIPGFRELSSHHNSSERHAVPMLPSPVYKYSTPYHHTSLLAHTSESFPVTTADVIFSPGQEAVYVSDGHASYTTHHSRIEELQEIGRLETEHAHTTETNTHTEISVPMVASSVDIY